MAKKILVAMGILAFVLVAAAAAAQLALGSEPYCTLNEFTCSVERDGDEMIITVLVDDGQDVRVSARGDCQAEPVFAKEGGTVTMHATCPHAAVKPRMDVAVLYDVDSKRNAATGRAVA